VSNLLELEIESLENGFARLRLGPHDRVEAYVDEGVRRGDRAIVTVRPERIAITENGSIDEEVVCHASGIVRESLDAGPTTRFVVELDGGGELMVVRQNARTSFDDAEALRGKAVTLVWGREYTRVMSTTEEGNTQ